MTPADILLDHFDRITGSKPRYVQVSDEGTNPVMHVAIYRGFPEPEAITGFTIGLSHFHPPGGAHKELTISMRDAVDNWALACGFLGFKLRERCPFVCGDTINFGEPISKSSPMSAFVIVHPLHISSRDSKVDLGMRQVELAELVPIYQEERAWLLTGGDLRVFLRAFPGPALMDPGRKPYAFTIGDKGNEEA